MIEKPTVTTNDQGQDADKQAGPIAHNDIPAATNDRTDAPRLDVEPAAVEDTLPSPMAGPLDPNAGSHNDALISADAAGEPGAMPEPPDDQVSIGDELVASEDALTPQAQTLSDVADIYASATDGVWQCQNPKCTITDPDRAFAGPRQQVVQAANVPLHCPNCGADTVLYIGDREVTKEAV